MLSSTRYRRLSYDSSLAWERRGSSKRAIRAARGIRSSRPVLCVPQCFRTKTRSAQHKHSPALMEPMLHPFEMLTEHYTGTKRARDNHALFLHRPAFCPLPIFWGQNNFPLEESRYWIEATDYSFACFSQTEGACRVSLTDKASDTKKDYS